MKVRTPEVNFLRRQREILAMQSKRLQIIHNFSLIALLSYVVFLGALFSYSGFLKLGLSKTEKEIVSEKSKISEMSDIKVKYYALKNKTKVTKEIADGIYKHQEIIVDILGLIPNGMEIGGLNITEEGKVRFSVSTFDNQRIKEFVDEFLDNKNQNEIIFNSVSFDNVRVNEEGKYEISVNINSSNKIFLDN